jgi:flagellar biosynthesis/type III secretory pathway M-ring protein FliF/YscJ
MEKEQYSLSPRSGRLRKKVRLKYKKKKTPLNAKGLKKILTHPLLIILIITLFALITYYFMPSYRAYYEKYRTNEDENTKGINKRIRDTDVYH